MYVCSVYPGVEWSNGISHQYEVDRERERMCVCHQSQTGRRVYKARVSPSKVPRPIVTLVANVSSTVVDPI